MFSAIRNSLSLKISIALAGITLVITSVVAIAIISRQTEAMQDMTLTKATLAAKLGAQSYARMMEDAIDNGYLTVQDVFDRNYQEIKGYDWGGKPKYHTKYDFYTDRVGLPFQDRFLDSKDIVMAVASDANGYVPTHNSVFQKPISNDPAKDTAGNRSKRIFNDEVALKASRNEGESLIQEYMSDTGAQMWDVSSPIFVKGKHWGGFRVLVSKAEIAAKRSELVIGLVLMFGIFALLSVGAIFFMIRRSTRSLVELTHLADQISLGEGLENPITAMTTDEVGMMASSVDRLRSSLKAAMARLGE